LLFADRFIFIPTFAAMEFVAKRVSFASIWFAFAGFLRFCAA
jgi:hypothetical protein